MKRLRLALILIGSLIIVIVLLPTPLTQTLRGTGSYLLSPLLRANYAAASWIHTRFTNLKELDNLHQDNLSLKKHVLELEQQVIDLAAAAQENETLRAELGITNRPSADETVAASIISRSANNLLGEALVDQGSEAGIQTGQAVMSQGVLVGRVKEVYTKNSLIALVTSTDTVFQAMLTDSEALGLISGGPTGLKLTEIDQGITIKEGEIVQTSGLGGVIPRGLIIGEVDRVTSESRSAKQEALVRSSIDFDQLRLVFIILRNPTP